jgi:hypothetical protein
MQSLKRLETSTQAFFAIGVLIVKSANVHTRVPLPVPRKLANHNGIDTKSGQAGREKFGLLQPSTGGGPPLFTRGITGDTAHSSCRYVLRVLRG